MVMVMVACLFEFADFVLVEELSRFSAVKVIRPVGPVRLQGGSRSGVNDGSTGMLLDEIGDIVHISLETHPNPTIASIILSDLLLAVPLLIFPFPVSPCCSTVAA
eukprot:CAMPEP_0197542944 /NCGR_PEP_ID=MMETSP1318-20131121/67975_1 /TAXON_ID=552666 /ORGANISM="Partenskyella glossopodia, Strain RCC365" /LENGTH=104 /DNA_ID=CAMNT_0043102243 /DNA_START=1374 /DNA_END=1688 /DNA_ORIENTATION=+